MRFSSNRNRKGLLGSAIGGVAGMLFSRSSSNAESEFEKEEREKMELERDQWEAEQEWREDERIEKLHREGNSRLAWFYRLRQNGWVLFSGMLFGGALLFFWWEGESVTDLHFELEQKAFQLELLIAAGEKEQAALLLNEFFHDGGVICQACPCSEGKWGFKDCPTYSEYWGDKRRAYQEQILALD